VTGTVCSVPGCPELTPCRIHANRSSRNHRGIPRQQREHGAPYDGLAREFRGQRCQLRLPGCVGTATGR
jgi:hypothetical protein